MTRKELITSDEWIQEFVENSVWRHMGNNLPLTGHCLALYTELADWIKEYRDELLSLNTEPKQDK